MKRYRFPLEPVLRVRLIEQDAARAALVAAHHGFRVADDARHRTVARYRALPVDAGAETTDRWLARRTASHRTAACVVAAEADTEAARARMDDQRSALQQARMRTSALERLDGRRREEHELESRRAEDAEVDELVTARHGRHS